MASLREMLPPDELEEFLRLRREGLSDELAIRFQSRYQRELENVDFLRKASRYDYVYGVRFTRPEDDYQKMQAEYDERRAGIFEKVLKDLHKYNVPFHKGTERDLTQLVRSVHVDEKGEYKGMYQPGTIARESLAKQLAEDGVLKFAGKTALSAITTPLEGAADAYAGRGWGEHPLEYTAKVGSAVPLLRAGGSLLSGGLARSGLRAATRQLPPDAQTLIKQLVKNNASPAQITEALGGAGFNRARAGELLQKAVQHPVWKHPARGVEAADILGAREEHLSEIVGELMLEGGVAGGKLAYDTARPGTPQERRKAANDAAAAERFQRIQKPKLDAALDANALIFAQITQEIAARKTELTPEDIASISDESFVIAFENHLAPHIQEEIDALEAAGLENAGDMLRARMLQLHQRARPQPQPEISVTFNFTGGETANQEVLLSVANTILGRMNRIIELNPDIDDQGLINHLETQIEREVERTPDLIVAADADKIVEGEAATAKEAAKESLRLALMNALGIKQQGGTDATELTGRDRDSTEQTEIETTDTAQQTPEQAATQTPETSTPDAAAATQQTAPETETVELTPEEIEAQAQADAEALVASANRPNQFQVENALESVETPVDAEAFIEQFGDQLPQAYRENPRAVDLFLNQLATDEASRVTATETDGVRQYTAEAAVDTVPDTQKGTETTAYMTDASPYKVRPVIRELDDLVPSHDIEGNKTPDYPEDLQPREGRDSLTSAATTRENAGRLVPDKALTFPVEFDTGPPLTSKRYPGRTVAGTGRTNMLKYARDNHPERWQAYQDALREELEITGKKSLGIDPAVLEGMDSPVLTYELVENVDEVAIAEDTNISSTLDTTGREQAKHDARRLFDADTLALWNTDADPDADATEALAPFDAAVMAPANERFRTTLISRIPQNLRPDFLSKDERTKKETLGKKGIERLKDALMYYIFEGSETAQRLIDEGAIEDAPKIKLMLDYILVDLAYVKARGLDISKELDAAIYRLISFSKRADAAPKAEKDEFNKTERMWKEVNSYLSQPLADGGQDSPLERQILYLLYTKRGAEKQLAGHFHEWAVQAVDFLAQQESSMFEADDPAVLSARVFDVVIKRYLEAEAFQIDKDRVNEANPWRTPSNLPPELRDIRREIDEIASSTEQTTTFNDWVKNFLEHIRSLDTQTQGDTDTDTEAEAGYDDAFLEQVRQIEAAKGHTQQNPIDMSFEELEIAREEARQRHTTDFDAALAAALGGEEQARRFKRMESEGATEAELIAEFGKFTPEQWAEIYGHSAADPRLDHDQFDELLRAHSDVFSVVDESGNISEPTFAFEVLSRALRETKPEEAKTALAAEGHDISLNVKHIANAIRIKEIINALRGNGYTQEQIASGVATQLSRWVSDPEDIDLLLSPWFTQEAPDATQETPTTDETVEPGTDTGVPPTRTGDSPTGGTARTDTETPGTPESPETVAPTDEGTAAGDESVGTPGDETGVHTDDTGSAVEDGLGPRFSEMDADALLEYLQSENIVYVNRSRDGEWANFRVGQDYSDAGIGTGVTVQLQTPQDGTVRARLVVIDRNTEVITGFERDIASTAAKVATARAFLEGLTRDDIHAALGGETTPTGEAVTKTQVEEITGRAVDAAAIRDINEILDREENLSYWHLSSITLTHDDAGRPVRMTQAQAEQIIALAKPETAEDAAEVSAADAALEAAINATFTGGAVTLESWNASTDAEKRSAIQRAEQSLPILERAGTLSPEEADARRAAIETLQRSITDTPDPDTETADTETDTETDADIQAALKTVFVDTVSMDTWNASTDADKKSSLQKALQSLPRLRQAGTITAEELTERQEAIKFLRQSIQQPTQQRQQQPSSGAGTPTDTNQVVGTSRQIDDTETAFEPAIQSALNQLSVTAETWQTALDDGTAFDMLNRLATDPNNTEDPDNAAAISVLHQSLDDRPDASPEETEGDPEAYSDDLDDDNLLKDVQPGRLRDITDEQRSDFEAVRRKVFLAKTIARLEAKADRTLEEILQLAALKAPHRNDAQQEIYKDLLTRFIDGQVTRLQAKTDRSTTEERILSALAAVQAEGIPVEASDRSLYSDLDTPEQEHSSPLAETRTLAGVQAPDTADTEVNLPDAVTADTNKLSPAQLTSVKAIIAAFKRKIHIDTDTTVQGGFLLADKPGVGKTRQALAAIWHYMRQGVQKHFILAPNPQLLNNYSTDFAEMGGNAADLSNYNSQNRKPTTPVATSTYATLISKPDIRAFNTPVGNQNAIADIIEHLTGVRPTLAQTHPLAHRAAREAFTRIGIHNVQGTSDAEIVDNAVTELRAQAKRVNLDNATHVENFRRRVTPPIADILLSERQGGGTQLHLGGGSDLHSAVAQLLTFAQTHISAQPDPDFAEKAAAFEGVIVLDEMHKAAGTQSQTGLMIDKLTELLPNAKFLYMSATPFKEINNFFVASRLGLWGANQAFPNFKFFGDTFKHAARAVKEIIPLHLKQIGRYISRALSAAETQYSPVELPLSDAEKAQYDTATQFVQTIRQRFEASIDEALRTAWGNTLEEQKAFHRYKAKYMRMFYNQTQKFFLAVLDSMKAQGLTKQIQEQLENGDKIIVQLENTWTKTTENAKRRGTATPGPFDLLIDFVENENLFPVHVHVPEVRKREDGTEYVVPIKALTFENGKETPIPDPKLKQIQLKFLDTLRTEMRNNESIGELPFAADIIHAAAAEINMPSGEISGRETNTEKRIQMSKDFSETTDLNLIVLGPAGLTGINLPVTKSIAGEVDNLYHYLVQSSWNVNTFEQGLGRGKRANSAIDPHYIIAHQDLPGADRVLGATLAKFAEMGALAGQADSALMQNVDKTEGEADIDDDPEADVDTDDVFEEDTQGQKGFVFGQHGYDALAQLWVDIYHAGDMTIADTLGLPHPEFISGELDPKSVPTVEQFFQRLLHQPVDRQPEFYQEFEARLKRILAYNKELGTLDTGANDLNATDGQIQDRLTIYTDPDTGQTAEVVKLRVKRKLPRRSREFLEKVIRQAPGYEQHGGDRFAGIYTDADGNIWAMFENPYTESADPEYIRWGPRGTPVAGIHKGENRVTATQLAEDFTQIVATDASALDDLMGSLQNYNSAKAMWEAEDASADTHVDSEMYMLTGLMLPKWRDISTGRRDAPVMGIIPMADGSNLHGRVVPESALSATLGKFGGVDPNYFNTENRAEAPPLPDDPNIDIPALVKEIVGEATDTRIKARLENIVEHIHKKLPLTLRGHLVRSAQEAALLGQLIRDPQVEHVWIVYRREGRIVKIEPMSLNRKGEADAGDFNHIKAEAGRLHADAVLRIHNHPSGVARWSQADKDVAMDWHSALGTLMAEDIIVDSGTFAYRTFENGKYTWHEDVNLNPHAAGWDTTAPTVSNTLGAQKPTDPLYQNPLIHSAWTAATYMWHLKRDMGVMELVFVDPQTGKITDTITERLATAPEDNIGQVRNLLAQRPGQHVHVMTWDGSGFAEALNTANIDGVDSVWEKSQRLTGREHTRTSRDQTVTDPRTVAEKETDAILNRVFERLTGKEQPGTQRRGPRVQSPKPHKTVPKAKMEAIETSNAENIDRFAQQVQRFIHTQLSKPSILESYVTPEMRTQLQNAVRAAGLQPLKEFLTVMTGFLSQSTYSKIQELTERYFLEHLSPHLPKNVGWEAIQSFLALDSKNYLNMPSGSGALLYEMLFKAFGNIREEVNIWDLTLDGDLIIDGVKLKKNPDATLKTVQIDGQTFYLTPLNDLYALNTPTAFQELSADEQAAATQWLQNTDISKLQAGEPHPITGTLLAYRYAETDKIMYARVNNTTAEHMIRHGRVDTAMGVDIKEGIYNKNKLLASRHIATTSKSNWDAITDNADFVFLAPLSRSYRNFGLKDGFGFDAEALIRDKGAVVGTQDSIAFYDALVERIVQEEIGQQKTSRTIDQLAEAANTGQETFEGAQRILQRIKNEIGDAAKDYRVAGEAAIQLLREGKVAEILVPGELSLDDLLYIAIDGGAYGLVQATSTPDTITRDVGGKQQEFVKVTDDSNTLSDPNAPLQMKKPFVVAGISHYMVRDEGREDVSLDNRTRGDAEHIVSAKRTLDVERLDAGAVAAAREAINTAVSETPDTTERDARQAEHDTAKAYRDALQSFTFDVIGATAREALALIEANPVLQTPELKAIFESVDPDAKTYDFDANDKIWEIRHATRDRIYELEREISDLKTPIHIDPAVVEQVKSLHAQLSASETYRRALQDLILQTSTVQEALDMVAATPALQTDVVQNLLSGVDPNTRLYDIEFRTKLSEERSGIYDTQNKIKDQLQQLRSQLSGWDQHLVFDMIEEINQTHRMDTDRIKQGVSKLSEDAQAKINPLLEKVWSHIATEKGVFDTVMKSGVVKATHKSGDPNVNEGLLAYTSYSAYYRRSEGFHNYGFIFDMEKLLQIPGTTGTVHDRGDWSQRATLESPEEIRQAMETWHDPGDQDIVIEIRTPEDIDMNEYLIGVIVDQEVYIKPSHHRDPEISTTLREYQPTTANRSMPRIESMLMTGKRGTGDAHRFVNPSTELFNKMRLWTPQLRKGARVLANALYSGYGKLAELKAPQDATRPAPGDVLEDTLDERMYISGGYSSRVRQLLLPSLKALDQQVKAAVRAAPAAEGRTVQQLRAEVDFSIIEFIEKNTPLKPAHQAFAAVARDIKEAWRQVNGAYLEAMIQLVRTLSADGEQITKIGSRGRELWSPEPLKLGDTLLVWSWDVQDTDGADGAFVTQKTLAAIEAAKEATPDGQGTLNIDEGFRTYTVAEAVAAADGLWYPHQYDRDKLRHYNRKIEGLVKALNTLAAEGEAAAPEAFAAAGVTKVDGGYAHPQAGKVFPDIESIIAYWTEIQSRTETLIQMYENGTVGFYPHLERVRETHDQLYKREVNLLIPTAELLWDRYAEIDMFGQIDPYSDLPPRLAKMLEAVEMYNANDREAALMAVIEGTQESGRSEESLAEDDRHWGMHESIPAFASGEAAAYRIMQQWEDYYLTDDDGNRLPKGESTYINAQGERVKGRKVKTGDWKGIDINRLNLDSQTLETLQQIGFIQPDGQGGWKVYGETDAAQQQTLARFFVELMQTKQDRRNSVETMVQALGHWQLKSPLDQDSGKLWRKFNTFITIGALGPKQALQNLVEIPTVPMVVGLKSTQEMIRLLQQPNFKAAAQTLGLGLKQGVEFLADDNLQEKYLDSWVSMFGKTEAYSRMIGVAAGLAHARSLTEQLVNATGKKRAAIAREMRTWRMDPDAVSNLSPAEIGPLFEKIIEGIKDGTLALGGVDVPSHRRTDVDAVGDAFVRSAMYISDAIFKPYDARTLPPEFQKDSPFGRMFLKFKGWMFQQNRFMFDQWRRAAREAKRGNFTQLSRMVYGTAILTGAVAVPQILFAALQGREEDDELLRAFLHTQTLGLTAVMWEMLLRSEGNPWRLEKTLEGTFVGPVFGVFADVLAPAGTGDLSRSLREIGQRTPVAREALYLGVDRWWTEDEESR